nr:hypothetical protein [uncultured Desulfobacter sp.]
MPHIQGVLKARLDQAAKSDDWPERLISQMIHPWVDQFADGKCRNNSNKGGDSTSPVYEYSTGGIRDVQPV